MAAPAAPVVVEGGALAAVTGWLILAVLIWCALFGLQKFYTYTLGAVVRGLAGLIDKAVPFYDLGSSTVGKIDDGVQAAIGAALSAAEANVSRTWAGLTWIVRETGETLELFAHATVEAIHALTHGEIPAQIRANVIPQTVATWQAIGGLGSSIIGLRATVYAQAAALEHDLDRLFGQARAGIDALRRETIPALRRELAGVEADLGRLDRYARGTLDRRLGKVEAKVAGAAVAAGVLAVIARYAPWVRCSNVGKLGRTVCRTDTNLLESLLAGSLLVAGSLSLAQFARELAEPTELVMGGLEGFVRELRRIG